MANWKRGRQSFSLPQPPVITHWASVAGKKEAEGPLGKYFDITKQDAHFGQSTWEQDPDILRNFENLLYHPIVLCFS